MADDFMILFHDSGYRCLKHFYLIVNMLGAIAAYCMFPKHHKNKSKAGTSKGIPTSLFKRKDSVHPSL